MKNFAWNIFKKTGSIDTYLEFKKLRNLEEDLGIKSNENIKSEWNNNSRK